MSHLRNICLLLIIVCQWGCSSARLPLDIRTSNATREQEVYTIAVKYRGQEQLSGLLLVRSEPNQLSYNLLSSMGMTLVHGKIDENGDGKPSYSAGIIAQTPLPEALRDGLYRIFFSKKMMGYQLSPSAERWYGHCAFILPLWRVAATPSTLQYRQYWTSLELLLKRRSTTDD